MKHQELVITRADKGNLTVVLDSDKYHDAMIALLNDQTTYTPIPDDWTEKTEQTSNKLVKKWVRKKYISKTTGKRLSCTNAVSPRIYALPKIHKPGIPFRPIVSSIGGPTYVLSSWLHRIIKAGSSGFFSSIKDSFEFATFIREIELPNDYVIISLDVSSLFTNSPLELVKRALRRRKDSMVLKKMSINEFIEAVEFVMSTTTFSFEGNYYRQTYGLPMGSPLAPTLADIVMQDLEFTCMQELDFFIPFYKRFVDDIIMAVPKGKVDEVVAIFNRQHKRLNFTFEVEVEGQIPFLDLLLIHRGNRVITNWYRKPTWTGRYLNFFSHHPLSQKRGTVFMLVDRAYKLGHEEFLNANLRLIVQTLLQNDYPKSFIAHWMHKRLRQLRNEDSPDESVVILKETPGINRTMVLPYAEGLSQQLSRVVRKFGLSLISSNCQKLGKFIKSTKDKLKTLNKVNTVYCIPCGDCDQVYIGQTKRALKKRVREHQLNINKTVNQHTALTNHILDRGHQFKYEDIRVLGQQEYWYKRNILEMYHITKDQRTVNFRSDVNGLSNIYSNLIR